MSYYMTSDLSGETGHWERCRATTLAGAKREASREYGAGRTDATLKIATGDGLTEQRHIVAARTNIDGSRWQEQ